MQLSDWLAQPPVMAGYGGGAQYGAQPALDPQQAWLQRHPQFGGQQGIPGNEMQQPVNSAYQAPNLGQAGNPFNAIFGMMNGHPNLAAWRDRRMAAGLPVRSQHQHQMGQANPFNVQGAGGPGIDRFTKSV